MTGSGTTGPGTTGPGTPPDAARNEEGVLPATRRVALLSLGATVAVAAAAWWWVGRASDAGLARLTRIDAARVPCDSLWASARTMADTIAADRVSLSDTIDARSSTPLARCGDLRGVTRGAPAPGTLPNNREMTGEPMPRGLR